MEVKTGKEFLQVSVESQIIAYFILASGEYCGRERQLEAVCGPWWRRKEKPLIWRQKCPAGLTAKSVLELATAAIHSLSSGGWSLGLLTARQGEPDCSQLRNVRSWTSCSTHPHSPGHQQRYTGKFLPHIMTSWRYRDSTRILPVPCSKELKRD